MQFRFKQLIISEVVLFIAVLCYRFLLDACFVVYLDKLFDYKGFSLNFDPFKFILSVIMLSLVFKFTPKTMNKASDVVFQFLFLIMFVPFTSYFSMSDQSFIWFFLFSFFWGVTLLIYQINFEFKTLISPFLITEMSLFYILSTLAILVFLILFATIDFKFVFNLYNVYELRAQNPFENIPFSGYFINWTAKVILPFLLCFSIVKFKPILNFYSVITLLFIFTIFSISGHKVYLFAAPMLIAIVLLLKSRHFFFHLLVTFITLIIIGLSMFIVLDDSTILTFFVRRSLFIPAQLSFYFYDFFEGNSILLSNSIFRHFIHYPYSVDPAYLIGEKYFDAPEMSANNGIIADGFLNFGVAGILLWSFFFVLILKLIDAITVNKSNLILWPVILMGIKNFVDGALFAGLLTHGFIVIILLCYIYPFKKSPS